MPNPVPNQTITIQITDTTVATATTDASGVYTLDIPINSQPGLLQERSMFAGQGPYLAANSTYENFQVTPNTVATVLTAIVTPATVEQGQSITVSGTLMTAD